MPKLLLTKRNIDSKKHIPLVEKGQVDYFDEELKGLLLRVGKSSKVFYVQIDVKDAVTSKFKTVKEKIGAYGEYTPEQARAKAPDIIRRIREGGTAEVKPPTLQMMYDRYLKDKKLTDGTLLIYKGYIPRLFESWLTLPLNLLEKALAPEIVIDKYQHIHGNNGPSAANNSFKCLQAIINYAEILYPQFIGKNPIRVLSRAEMWARIEPREECLEPNQFKIFADALLTCTPAHRDCYMLALYHGIRPQEAYSLKWENVDFDRERITLVHETQTSKRTYTVPMSRQSKQILARRKEAASEGQDHVFPKQGARNKHDHLILRSDDIKRRTGLDLTVHALRSSFITTGERLRLRRQDINILTGHADQTVTGRHYVRLTPDDMKPVLQAIANEIERLMVDGVGEKIV
ncbi:MAG: integrase family protein [Desulfuromonadaceae bacterium]|nr:integrase family protein [Desulfuromonadaceae bacterium]